MVTSNGKGNPIKTFESQMQFLQNHATEVTLVLDCSLTINSFHKKPNSIRSLYTNLNLVKRLFNNGTCQFFKPYSKMPAFRNQMRVKYEHGETASQSFLGWKPRKLLLFGPSIALEGLIWRPNSGMKQIISLQWFNL